MIQSIVTKLSNPARMALLAVPAMLLAMPDAAAAAVPLGPEAAACRPGAEGPALLVNVKGFRKQTGTIRVQVHAGPASGWLKKNAHLKRIELPVTAAVMPVCVKVPAAGRYAVAVRHDEDGDRTMTSKDGGGFSRNPKLAITKLSPRYEESVFTVGERMTSIDVIMNYLQGLAIRPVR